MTTSIFSESWCGIIFDGRNQQYGAYELRKSNERNTLFAILLSVSFLSVGLNVMLLGNDPKMNILLADEKKEEDEPEYILEDVELQPLPQDEPEATKSELQPTPVFAATETFTTIQIVVDSTQVDTVATQESFGEKQPGSTNQGGDSTATASIETIETKGQSSGQATQTIVDFAEVMPQFPGGENALLKFIGENTKYPGIAVENELEAKVHVQFVVDRDGSLTDVRVENKNHKCLDDEAMRVVKSMPKWTPGKQNGELVKVRFRVPIKFVLD